MIGAESKFLQNTRTQMQNATFAACFCIGFHTNNFRNW